MSRQTIFALSTAAGKAGVAVIRVSGPAAHAAARSLLPAGLPEIARTAQARILRCPDTGEHLDRALVLHFEAPRSFTGEHVVEFHVHGGNATVRSVLGALGRQLDLRPAGPGEFTRQSLLNGKLDLTQAEALADLIHAETAAQQRQALRNMDGEAGRLYAQWRSELIGCMAHIEALIDFGEDEAIEAEVLPLAIAEVKALRDPLRADKIHQHLTKQRCGERVRKGVRVTIVGRPNVGKSSMMNKLSQRQIAIVTPVPGTTRDVLETMLDLDGFPVVLQDTAGVRHGADVCEVEQEGIRRAEAAARNTDLRVCVQDLTDSSDKRCVRAGGAGVCACAAMPGPTLLCFNKRDQVPALLVAQQMDAAAHAPLLSRADIAAVSCLTGDGWDDFVKRLAEHVGVLCGHGASDDMGVTHARHRSHLEHCLASLDTALKSSSDIEILAEELRIASWSLAAITGKIHVEDVLDVVFSTFCIGK